MAFLWPRIQGFSFFHKHPSAIPKEEVDILFAYLFSLIVQQENILKEKTTYEETRRLPDPKRTINLLRLYNRLETFLLTNAPPKLKETFTQESLRELIKKNVHIERLDYRFQLIFLTGTEQLFFLFRIALDPLATYIVDTLGVARLQSIIDNVKTEHPLVAQLHVISMGIDYHDLQASLPLDPIELTTQLKALSNALYQELNSSIGQKNALELMRDVFLFVRESYEASIATRFLTILPEGTLEIERLTFLSREELEQQVKEEIVEKAKVKEAQAKNEALLTSIGEGVIASDIDRRILFINLAAEEILGWTGKEVVGLPIEQIIQLQDVRGSPIAAGENPIIRAFSQPRPINAAYYCLRKDKSKFLLSLTASSVLTDNKQTGIILLLRDVTKATESERTRIEFFSLISHELATPLASIAWNTEMLLQGKFGQLPPASEDILKRTLDINNRMIHLINTLLTISKIDQGTISNEPVNVDIRELVTTSTKQAEEDAKQKEVNMSATVDQNVQKEIAIDPKLLREVLQNLLTNAIKFNKPKGNVTIHVSQKEKILFLTVSDTGIGIPIKDQEKIFSRSFRAGNVLGTTASGYGLELHIAKSLVETWGGTMTFESQEGVGTTFTITIPQQK